MNKHRVPLAAKLSMPLLTERQIDSFFYKDFGVTGLGQGR